MQLIKIAKAVETLKGTCLEDDGTGCPVALNQLETVFSNVVSILISLAGIVVFLMFLSGGFKFLTAGGDPKKTESARNTLTYAIGGLVLVALAFLIISFIANFTGVDITNFRVYLPY